MWYGSVDNFPMTRFLGMRRGRFWWLATQKKNGRRRRVSMMSFFTMAK